VLRKKINCFSIYLSNKAVETDSCNGSRLKTVGLAINAVLSSN